MQISATSPLESLATFPLEFGAGVASAAIVQAYGPWVKRRSTTHAAA